MTEFEIRPETVAAHRTALAAIADSVGALEAPAAARVGDNDYGVLFAMWLVPMMNWALDGVREGIAVHKKDVETHRAEFQRTIDAAVATDADGSAAIAGVQKP